ncbi:MAG: RNA-directed DNA polymerase [Gammaproteobacteria bacterium]|nr:RNA-directed DNA polymerase [Gammaproteobacteria bacterium]
MDFAQENGFTIGGLKFNKKTSKKVTWTAPNGQLHQNDHILIRSKWQNSLKNCESYVNPSVQSDHRIVTATIKLSLRANIKRPKVIKYDWEKLKSDPQIKEEFQIQVENRFEALASLEVDNTDDIELHYQHIYTNMISAINDTAEKTLPKRKKSSLNAQILSNPDYIAAVKARDTALKLSHIRKTRAATKDLRTATLKVREVETGIQEAFVNNAIDKIDQQFLQKPANNTTGFAAWQTKSNSSGIAWKLINDLTNRKPKSVSPLPGYKNKTERAEAWTNHYSKLLYNPTDNIRMDDITVAEPELPISTSPFTIEELETALKQTKDTYGHDGIPSLLYKSVDLNDILLPLFNNMLDTGKAPEELLVTAILPIPKGSKKFCPENSRGISILPVATKIYNRLLLNRIRSHIEPRLRYNQNGFRPGRGTREQILALRRIIEEAINFQLPCVISFIDFSKAFDCIFRSHLPDILASYGFPITIIKAIMSLYMNTKAKIMTPEGTTLVFLTNLGILQGDVLAPLIFIIVLDFILKLAIRPQDGIKVGNTNIADFDFADDIATVTDSFTKNSRLCQSISDIAAHYGLLINIDKTKYMFYNIPRPVNADERVFVNAKPLEEVNDFKYLGSYIASTSKDINVRKGLAWKALQSLEIFWKSNMSRKIKTKIFRTAVEPVLLYGAETWTLKKADVRALDGVYTRMLRRVFGISWKSHTPNTVLYGNIPPVTDTIKTRRLRFAGHIHRLQDQPVQQLLFWQPSYGRRYQGRPHKTFPDVLYEDTGLDQSRLCLLMENRDEWREAVSRNSFQSSDGSP